jgi:hypothetical protein
MRPHILLLALAAWLGAGACGEVERCAYGTRGCFGGPPQDGECKLGLVMSHGTCSEPGSVAPPLSCECDDGRVCSLDAYRCIDYCEPIDFEPGSVEPPPTYSCDAATLSLEGLCRNRCRLECQQQAALCPGQPTCADGYCDGPDVLRTCRGECDSADDARVCMAELCSELRARSCGEVLCPNQRLADCQDVHCTNNCPGFNFDGVCDDGDLESAASGVCEYGSDCADCGARTEPAPRSEPQGGACAFHSGCEGANSAEIAEAEAWCGEIAAGVTRCIPDCTSEGETCPEGSGCFVLSGVDQDGDGEPDPIEQDDLAAAACFPLACE